MITQQELLDRFEYRDGELYRRTTRRGCRSIGSKVGSVDLRGYVTTFIDYQFYRIHRLIFMMHHGYTPDRIDHIDGDTGNNRIENLREVTQMENMCNRKISKTNKSGVKNVSWSNHAKSWRVDLMAAGKKRCFGYFKDIEAA